MVFLRISTVVALLSIDKGAIFCSIVFARTEEEQGWGSIFGSKSWVRITAQSLWLEGRRFWQWLIFWLAILVCWGWKVLNSFLMVSGEGSGEASIQHRR